jgi:monoamine oxidase
MTRRGIDEPLRQVITQFLAGVLAEDEMSTSRRFGEFLIRSFVRGLPGLPAGGIQAVPEQLASGLPAEVLAYSRPVRALNGTTVETDGGAITADAVIIATDPRSAARLLAGPEPEMKWFTTYYHRIPSAPKRASWLHVDLDRSGPLVNTAAVSRVQPTYADRGTLLASTVLGRHDQTLEPEVRRHAAHLLDTPAEGWEFVRCYPVESLPAHGPGQSLRRSVKITDGLFIAGDHRDSPSVQGALVSGRRAADAVLAGRRSVPASRSGPPAPEVAPRRAAGTVEAPTDPVQTDHP